MNLRQKRLADAVQRYASENILAFEQAQSHGFGIISVIKAEITEDYAYADIYVRSQKDERNLPHFLAPIAHIIQKKLAKDFSLRKIPALRFRRAQEISQENDILSLIHSLDAQYGLSHENS